MSSAELTDLLRLARAYTAQHLPWFAPALYRCKIIPTEAVNVAAIDLHYNVYWNPTKMAEIRAATPERTELLAQLAFIWIHEISHVLRDHAARRADIGGEAFRWNVAADFEINDADWAGTAPPVLFPPLLPAEFELPEGQLAEWYYKRDETAQLARRAAATHDLWFDDGSGSHGEARPWELHEDAQRITDAQRELIRRDVAEEMWRAPGSAPGGWAAWVNEVLEPKVDWRQLLRSRLATAIAVGSGARADYSYRRPGRRQSTYDPIVLPTLSGARRSQLAVVVDTSGSMGGERLQTVMSEVYVILRAAHGVVTLLPTDVQSYPPIRLQSEQDLRRLTQLRGGGGTDMGPGIEAALALQPRPDAILVLTDGEMVFPPRPEAVPVIFGIVAEALTERNQPPVPPWGRDAVVRIPPTPPTCPAPTPKPPPPSTAASPPPTGNGRKTPPSAAGNPPG